MGVSGARDGGLVFTVGGRIDDPVTEERGSVGWDVDEGS